MIYIVAQLFVIWYAAYNANRNALFEMPIKNADMKPAQKEYWLKRAYRCDGFATAGILLGSGLIFLALDHHWLLRLVNFVLVLLVNLAWYVGVYDLRYAHVVSKPWSWNNRERVLGRMIDELFDDDGEKKFYILAGWIILVNILFTIII